MTLWCPAPNEQITDFSLTASIERERKKIGYWLFRMGRTCTGEKRDNRYSQFHDFFSFRFRVCSDRLCNLTTADSNFNSRIKERGVEKEEDTDLHTDLQINRFLVFTLSVANSATFVDKSWTGFRGAIRRWDSFGPASRARLVISSALVCKHLRISVGFRGWLEETLANHWLPCRDATLREPQFVYIFFFLFYFLYIKQITAAKAF